MSFFKKNKGKKIPKKQWKITKDCLNLILESSKDSYPNEFGALLRVDDSNKNIISELVLLPGTVSGDSHAIFRMHMRPIDFSIVGTVHSHPSFSSEPSRADLELFSKYGKVHIIAANPYSVSSWKGYDYNGNQVEIKLI